MKIPNLLLTTLKYYKYNIGKIVPLIFLWTLLFYLVFVSYNTTFTIQTITQTIVDNAEITLTLHGRFINNPIHSEADFPYNFNITDEINDLNNLLNEFKSNKHVKSVIEIKQLQNAFTKDSIATESEFDFIQQKIEQNLFPFTIPIYSIPQNLSISTIGIRLKNGRFFNANDFTNAHSIIVNENSGYYDDETFIPYQIGDVVQLQIYSGEKLTSLSLNEQPVSTIDCTIIGIYQNQIMGSDEFNSDNYRFNERFYVTNSTLDTYFNQWIDTNIAYNNEHDVNSKKGLKMKQLPLQYSYHQYKIIIENYPGVESYIEHINTQLNEFMHHYPINDDHHLYYASSSLDTLKDTLKPLLMLSNILIGFTLFIVILFNSILFVTNRYFINSRNKEFAIYRSMGNHALFTYQLYIEQFIIILIALPVSLIFAVQSSNILFQHILSPNSLYSVLIDQAINTHDLSNQITLTSVQFKPMMPLILSTLLCALIIIYVHIHFITKFMYKKKIRTLINDD